jgi:hypothetical protein
MNSLMKCHPGTQITIYSIPEIIVTALTQAVMPRNILFAAARILPFSQHVFEDSEFALSNATDRTNTNFQIGCISPLNCSATSLIQL